MNISNDNFSVALPCLFCGGVLEGKAGTKYESGDVIPCVHCGEGNDYDSVIEVAKEKGVAQVKEAIQAKLASLFKRR